MTNTTQKEYKGVPFSEEDVCVISKADPCMIWAGSKTLYSGTTSAGQASGYQYLSGESDVQPISCSGFGQIRIPELNQLHKIFVFPKDPTLIARPDYTYLNAAVGVSGYPYGVGGCSGKVALIHYQTICSGCIGTDWCSGAPYSSGIFDIIAFGSQM